MPLSFQEALRAAQFPTHSRMCVVLNHDEEANKEATAGDVSGLTAHINHADGNRKPAVIMINDE